MDEERLVRALRHPAAPHIDVLLGLRTHLAGDRDEFHDEGLTGAADAAREWIARIDVVLETFGYKHFSEGGDRWDQNADCVIEFMALLRGRRIYTWRMRLQIVPSAANT